MKQLLFLLFATVSSVFAIPQLISYQGQLTSPSGAPLDTTVAMTFTLYDAASGGTVIWTETHPSMVVTGGLFNVSLGSGTALTDSFGVNRWLGITVGGDVEMIPREQMTSVAHAYRVGTVDGASGGYIASRVKINGSLQVGSPNTVTHGNNIVVGTNNILAGQSSSITGGTDNVVEDIVTYAHIGGGNFNSVAGQYSSVVGGYFNRSNSDFAAVCGGINNQVDGRASAIGCGTNNSNVADTAYIGGGTNNIVTFSAQLSFIGGGQENMVEGRSCVIAGGVSNLDTGFACTIGGGYSNFAYLDFTTVGGGRENAASANFATVSGGVSNIAGGEASVVAGGSSNQATGQDAFVGGGWSNIASGYRSVVPGGASNEATSSYSFAGGHNSHAIHSGAFVWGDGWGTNLTSSANDQFSVRAAGGYRLYSNSNHTAGVTMSAGGNSWVGVSDSTKKRDIRLCDTKAVLEKIDSLPIKNWEYKSEAEGTEHVGPMAQDFWNAFHLGSDSLGIETIDADGVLFAAVQELAKQNAAQASEIAELKQLLQQMIQLGMSPTGDKSEE